MDELKEIKRDGGTPQPNSGRRQHSRFKGDGRLGPFVYDVKEYARSFALNTTNWAKVGKDAFGAGGEPALKIVLGQGMNTVRLWVIGDEMFKQMLEAWEEKYGGSA